jgi:hypothetical protein
LVGVRLLFLDSLFGHLSADGVPQGIGGRSTIPTMMSWIEACGPVSGRLQAANTSVAARTAILFMLALKMVAEPKA